MINENPFNCPIDDAQSLFMAAKDHFKNAEFFYCSKDNVKAKSELYGIDKREKAAKKIDGTLKLHQFTPVEGTITHLRVKETSFEEFWPRKQSIKIGYKNCL